MQGKEEKEAWEVAETTSTECVGQTSVIALESYSDCTRTTQLPVSPSMRAIASLKQKYGEHRK